MNQDRDEAIKAAIAKYLEQGGKIRVIAPRDDRYASHKTRWHYGGVNNYRKQYVNKNSCATVPGGGIEPRSPSKPWPAAKKNNHAKDLQLTSGA